MINKISIIFLLLSHSIVMAQHNFSIQYDLESSTIRGWEIQHYQNSLYMVAGKICFDPVRECGNVIKMDTDGNILWIKEVGAFDIGNSNRMWIVNDTITITGHRNVAEQQPSFFMEQLSLDGDSLTSYQWIFDNDETGGVLNYGTYRKENNWFIYGATLQQDGQVDAVMIEVDAKGKLKSKNIWDDGLQEFQLGDLQENKEGLLIGTAMLEPQNESGHRRAIIEFDDNLERKIIWQSELLNSIGISNNLISINDGGHIIVTPNLTTWKSSASPMLWKIGDSGEAIWQFEFDHIIGTDFQRNISNIKLTKNGDIIGVGFYRAVGQKDSAWMFKVSANGTLIWETTFAAYDWENGGVQIENDLNDLVELEDESIVGLGWIEESSLNDSPDDVWLVKVGPDGCLFEDDCNFNQGTTSIEETIDPMLRIYPNPVKDILFLDFTDNYDIQNIEIWDMDGLIVNKIYTETNHIEVGALSPGIYLLRFFTDDGQLHVVRFLKF